MQRLLDAVLVIAEDLDLDDGAGIDPAAARSGLRNLEDRARGCGGTLSVTPQRPHGTRLTWRAPLDGGTPATD